MCANLNKISRALSFKTENNGSDRCSREHPCLRPLLISRYSKGTCDARKILPEIKAIKSKANSYMPGDEVFRNAKMTSLR